MLQVKCGYFIKSIIWFFISSRRRHTRLTCDWSSDVCSSDLHARRGGRPKSGRRPRRRAQEGCAKRVDSSPITHHPSPIQELLMRLPPATRESVPQDQRDAFDEVVKGYGSIPKYGPGSVMINVPKAHQKVIALNRHLRNSTNVSKKLQELAMLVTAREFDCQYIWNAHAASGRSLGIADGVVDALRDRKELPKLPADELAVIRFGQEMMRT